MLLFLIVCEKGMPNISDLRSRLPREIKYVFYGIGEHFNKAIEDLGLGPVDNINQIRHLSAKNTEYTGSLNLLKGLPDYAVICANVNFIKSLGAIGVKKIEVGELYTIIPHPVIAKVER